MTSVTVQEFDDQYKSLVRQRASLKGKITLIIKMLENTELESYQRSLFLGREDEIFKYLVQIDELNDSILDIFDRTGPL